MSKIRTFRIKLNSKFDHNPHCDIVEFRLNKDSFITYVNRVDGDQACEYYSGKNYNVDSNQRSYLRYWPENEIPEKYLPFYNLAKEVYNKYLKNKTCSGKYEIFAEDRTSFNDTYKLINTL